VARDAIERAAPDDEGDRLAGPEGRAKEIGSRPVHEALGLVKLHGVRPGGRIREHWVD
jgi:hypothetical protein